MATDGLAIEHEIQRQMIERLGIEWTPGEPFYALVEDEIVRCRTLQRQAEGDVENLDRSLGYARADIDRLQAALDAADLAIVLARDYVSEGTKPWRAIQDYDRLTQEQDG